MRGALINTAEGMLPITTPLGRPTMTIQEAVFWLWRVRSIFVSVDFSVDEPDDGGTVPDPIHAAAIVTIPIGETNVGSRSEEDQLIKRRDFQFSTFDPSNPFRSAAALRFAAGLYPISTTLFNIGLSFSVSTGFGPIVSTSNIGTGLGDAFLTIHADDPILGTEYLHQIQMFCREGIHCSVFIEPATYQNWSDPNGNPLYNSFTGELVP